MRQFEGIFDSNALSEPAFLVFEEPFSLSDRHHLFFVIELFRVETKKLDPQGTGGEAIVALPEFITLEETSLVILVPRADRRTSRERSS